MFATLRDVGVDPWRFLAAELWIIGGALAAGGLAALIPALRVFRVDIAATLSNAR
jgi:putative ABC transport system permease protein